MPESPEVQALAEFLAERMGGKVITRGDLVDFSALKTFDPPLDALAGLEVSDVNRHGKFLDVDAQGVHLVAHLARAGWVTWHDAVPTSLPRPGKSGLAFRLSLDDDTGLSLTEAGKQRSLALYVVTDPRAVPGIGALGVDALAGEFTPEHLQRVLHDAGRAQLKTVLRDQKAIAGIGNGWSDEILHAARLSPFTPASSLDEDAVAALHTHVLSVLTEAVEAMRGHAPGELKAIKHDLMRVHGRTGEPCEACGGTIAEVSFADSSLQYCPTCQTGGHKLADRRMSKLLK